MNKITSKDNKLIKLVQNLISSKKSRDLEGLFVVEGLKPVMELTKEYEIVSIIVSQDFAKLNENSLLNANDSITYEIPDNLYKGLSYMTSPEGIMAIVKKPTFDINMLLTNDILKLIYLDNIQDPGNLGTIIRTADAFNISGVILSKNSVDAFSPKVVRSTMGSMFHLPIITEVDNIETLNKLKENNIQVLATNIKSNNFISDININESKICVVIGNEAHGVQKEIIDISDDSFKIKMPGRAESLNAGIAASIIMYELTRE